MPVNIEVVEDDGIIFKPKSVQLFDEVFNCHAAAQKPTKRSPLKRVQPTQENKRSLRRRQEPKQSLGTPSSPELSLEDRTRSWMEIKKKKRSKKKTDDFNLFDSTPPFPERKVGRKKPQNRPKDKKAVPLKDAVEDAWEKAVAIEGLLSNQEFDDLPPLNIVAERFDAPRSVHPKLPSPNIRDCLKMFEETNVTTASNVSRRSQRSRRMPITPVFGRQGQKLDSIPNTPLIYSPQVCEDGPLDLQVELTPRITERISDQQQQRQVSTACSVRTDIFERGLNGTNMASTPIHLAPKSRADYRVFFLPERGPSRQKTSVNKPIAMVRDPRIQQIISTPFDKTTKPFSVIENVSNIDRPASDASNNRETGFPSRYSEKTLPVPNQPKRSSSRLTSKKDSSLSVSRELSLDSSSVGKEETVMEAEVKTPSRVKSVLQTVSVEQFELPSMSEVNQTAIPRIEVQKPTPTFIATASASCNQEEEDTVKLRESTKTYSRLSGSQSSDGLDDLSTFTGNAIDPLLIEPQSLFLLPKTPTFRQLSNVCPRLGTSVLPSNHREAMKSGAANSSTVHFDRSRMLSKRSVMSTADINRLNISRIKFLMSEGVASRRVTLVSPNQSRETILADRDDLSKAMESFAIMTKTKLVLENGDLKLVSGKDKVLALCSPPEVTSFKKVLTKGVLDKITKIGEGSYGEIYLSKSPEGSDIVLKLVPFEFDVDPEKVFTSLLPEVMICSTFRRLKGESTLNLTPNFIDMMSASCIQGKFPKKLLEEWEKYDKTKKSQNLHPKHYRRDHLHLLMVLNNGGKDVESFNFLSARESLGCFVQIAFSLAAAEHEFEFEHRDLHWGNVLVKRVDDEPIIDYKVAGIPYEVPTGGVKVSIIDFSLSRMSKDGYILHDDLSKQEDLFENDAGIDYQFEIYRKMRDLNGNDWETFHPQTNIFWLEYMLHKLIEKKYTRSRTKEHQQSMAKLQSLKQIILDFESTKDFVESNFFLQLL